MPVRHRTAPGFLWGVSGTGMLFIFRAVFAFDLWPTQSGIALVFSGKLRFLDRMAWLRENMRDVNEEGRTWVTNSTLVLPAGHVGENKGVPCRGT